MKILHINTSDIEGGAARGAYWLHKGLQQAGIESLMLVGSKSSSDVSVYGPQKNLKTDVINRIKDKIDLLPLKLYPSHKADRFSPAWIPSHTYKTVKQLDPDIVNLHWVCRGLVKPENLPKFDKPIVWTLRDMWPFTGGCHNVVNCTRYMQSCGMCPHLDSKKEGDISQKLWQRKHKSWKNLDFTIVALSSWMADCAKQSSLFKDKRIEVIHNALDEVKFKPASKNLARRVLNLPQEKKIFLFGAFNAVGDKNKGFHHLIGALQMLTNNEPLLQDTELVVFGISKSDVGSNLNLTIPVTYLGRLHDDFTLVLVYSAADVMVVPSIQESFGKTAIEAMACGTPVVSFDTSGLKDIVEHKQCGYRAECYSSEDLANGITWVLQDEQRWQTLSHRAREKVEQEFTLKLQAQRYLALYEDILTQHRTMRGNGAK